MKTAFKGYPVSDSTREPWYENKWLIGLGTGVGSGVILTLLAPHLSHMPPMLQALIFFPVPGIVVVLAVAATVAAAFAKSRSARKTVESFLDRAEVSMDHTEATIGSLDVALRSMEPEWKKLRASLEASRGELQEAHAWLEAAIALSQLVSDGTDREIERLAHIAKYSYEQIEQLFLKHVRDATWDDFNASFGAGALERDEPTGHIRRIVYHAGVFFRIQQELQTLAGVSCGVVAEIIEDLRSTPDLTPRDAFRTFCDRRHDEDDAAALFDRYYTFFPDTRMH